MTILASKCSSKTSVLKFAAFLSVLCACCITNVYGQETSVDDDVNDDIEFDSQKHTMSTYQHFLFLFGPGRTPYLLAFFFALLSNSLMLFSSQLQGFNQIADGGRPKSALKKFSQGVHNSFWNVATSTLLGGTALVLFDSNGEITQYIANMFTPKHWVAISISPSVVSLLLQVASLFGLWTPPPQATYFAVDKGAKAAKSPSQKKPKPGKTGSPNSKKD